MKITIKGRELKALINAINKNGPREVLHKVLVEVERDEEIGIVKFTATNEKILAQVTYKFDSEPNLAGFNAMTEEQIAKKWLVPLKALSAIKVGGGVEIDLVSGQITQGACLCVLMENEGLAYVSGGNYPNYNRLLDTQTERGIQSIDGIALSSKLMLSLMKAADVFTNPHDKDMLKVEFYGKESLLKVSVGNNIDGIGFLGVLMPIRLADSEY